jgi:hypothetical protein
MYVFINFFRRSNPMSMKVKTTIVVVMLSVCLAGSTHARLTHRYNFATDANDVVGGLASTLVGDAVVSDGALVLDGVDDWLEMDAAGIAINTYTTGLTLELWCTQDTTDQGASMTAGFGDTWGNGLGKDYLAISTSRWANPTRAMIAITPDDDAPWADEVGIDALEVKNGLEQHYVLTIDDPSADGSGEMSYYIDGVLQGTVSLNGSMISGVGTVFAYLGKGLYSGDPEIRCSINEFRIHDTALTTQEVLASYTAGADTVPGAFLLNHRYDFSADANDVVGGLASTLVGDAAVTDGSLVLDGTDDWLEMDAAGTAINTYTTGLTLELWCTQDTTDQGASMTASFGDTWGNGLGKDYLAISTSRWANPTRAMIAITPDDDAPWADEVGIDALEVKNGLEQHYVLTIDDPSADGSGEMSYYIDGVLQGTVSLNGSMISGVGTVFAYLGKGLYSGDPEIRCSINEFRIYGTALTNQEVQANYLAGPDEIPVGVVPKSFPLDRAKITATASSSNDPNTMGAVNTINSSGLVQGKHSIIETDMWLSALGDTDPWIRYDFDQPYKLDKVQVWNYNNSLEPQFGTGVNDVNIVYSLDGTNWMTLENVTIDQAPGSDTYEGMSVDLNIAAKTVILDINSNRSPFGAPQYGLSEVVFYTIPVRPSELSPEDGTRELGTEVELSWIAGREAVTHEVYLGTDPEALDLLATLGAAETSYQATVELNSTYYWQIVEVNEAAVPTTWSSDILTFHTVVLPIDPGTDNLVHQYTFDDGTANDSVGSVHGTLVGDANIVDGSLVLDGVDDWMEMDASVIAINTFTTGLTLELVCTQDTADQGYSMTATFGDTWDNGYGKDYLAIATSRGGGGTTRGMMANTPDQDAPWSDEVGVDAPASKDGGEHHYALVVDDPAADGSGELSYFVDGILKGTVSLNGQLISNVGTVLAYLGKGCYPGDPEVRCSINEFSIYNKALTASGVLFLAGN